MNKFIIIFILSLFNYSHVFANPIINARTAILVDYHSDKILFELTLEISCWNLRVVPFPVRIILLRF